MLLSREETYADITPVRLNSNGVSAFVSIMRGCDNMCSFCVVPFTRGRERSRDAHSIVQECRDLVAAGYKEVTLLGQNVDSYKWASEDGTEQVNFAQLLEQVALLSPELRVRFSTSHPKDITDEVLHTMARYDNICNYIHLPAQSGNSRVLKLMNRTYDRPWYEDRVQAIRRILGEDCAISTDMISGFCSETEEEHQDTLEPDGAGAVRHGVHVLLLGAPRHAGRPQTGRRCSAGSEKAPPGRSHRRAAKAQSHPQPARYRAGASSAGGELLQTLG